MVSGISNNINGIKRQKSQNQNQNLNAQPIRFAGNQKSEYINPINRNAERTLAVFPALIFSTAAGAIAGVASRGLKAVQNRKGVAALIGTGVGAALAAMTIPASIYNANVDSYVRSNEMDVFSREKSVETNISEKIDQNTKNENVPLEQNIDNFFKYKAGKNGRGLGIFQS